jgi:uncharacterized protein (TIGR02246 family)
MMDQTTCSQFVRGVVESLLAEDLDAFISLFTADAILNLPNACCVGLDSIREAVQGLYQTYDNISIDLERVIAMDDVALVQWQWRDRNRFTGDVHETESAIVLEFAGAQIKRWREYHAPAMP